MSQLLDNLNPEQLAAVTLPPQHALILAGAGSGKTRVLTTRIAWLIQNGSGSAQGILAVTFTNKAAKEMLTRLSAMLPINTRGMWIGTFHGLCNRFLRAPLEQAGLPQTFQILDAGDQLAPIKRLIKALNIDDETLRAAGSSHGSSTARRRTACARRTIEVRDDQTAAAWSSIYQAYEDQCQREGVVDFAELMLRSYELLQRRRAPARALPARASATSWSTSSRTPTGCSTRWLKLLAAMRTAATRAAARVLRGRRRRPEHLRLPWRARSATWPTSSASSEVQAPDQAWSRTTAPTATSSMRPTR